MAPKARLVSLKVLDGDGKTTSSAVIAALAQIREFNAYGGLLIHGVNLSIGCELFPDEFTSGQSPLCRELDLLVQTGVVAVVSAGNSGERTINDGRSGTQSQFSTIEDPGNAFYAITVGSTHRTQPSTYGVTPSSSKGPTLDGRLKPDLVAPGEQITSAATGLFASGIAPLQSDIPNMTIARYLENSGTSIAAAHVSGAIAAFLSVKDEYIGQPDEVKQLFTSNATSLVRNEFFQGAGLLDLFRVLSKA